MKLVHLMGCSLAALLLAAGSSDCLAQPHGYSAASGPPTYWPGNGHYYQVWQWNGPVGSVWTWQEAKVFAENLCHQGLQGYLATITSQAEADWIGGANELRFAGLLGAQAQTAGEYVWACGPAHELGTPVSFYGSYVGDEGYPSDCLPVSRLYFVDRIYHAEPDWVRRVETGFRCSPLSDARFLVEFSDSTLCPVPLDETTWGRIKSHYKP